eukprot:11669541-Alexandrium_andersonii.AAC.1
MGGRLMLRRPTARPLVEPGAPRRCAAWALAATGARLMVGAAPHAAPLQRAERRQLLRRPRSQRGST